MIPHFVLFLVLSVVFYISAEENVPTDTLTTPLVSEIPIPVNADTSVNLEKVEVTARKVHKKEGSVDNGYRYSKAQIGPLGEAEIKDIPFSINVTSGQQIENRGAHILGDALKTNPTAVEIQLPTTDGRGQSEMNLRGFDPFYLQDGLLMRNTLPVPVEDVERIEVLNGLSGFFYGFGTPGGAINFITKQPLSAPSADFSVGQYNGGINFVHADVGGPVTKDKKVTSRINAYTEDGRSFIEGASQKRSRLSVAVNYQVLENTLLKTNMSHQDLLLQGQQIAFSVDPSKGINVPESDKFAPVKLYGQPWVYVKGKQDMAGLGVESRVNSIFKMRGAYNYSSIWRKSNGVQAALIDNSGNFSETYSDGAPENIFEHSAYALSDAKFKTWEINHKLTVGWTYDGTIRATNPTNSKTVKNFLLDTFNIAKLTYFPMPDTFSPTSKLQRTEQAYNSFLFGDWLNYGMFSVLAGANYTMYDYRNENIDTGLIIKYSQSKLSPSVAINVKPLSFVSAYTSYMQGIASGGNDPKAKNSTEVLSPSVNNQYEIGVKATIMNVDLASALFRINKINEFRDTKDSVFKQDGREIHQGLEVTATGRLWNCLTLGGGGTIMDAHIEKAADPAIKDKTPANVPEKQAKAFVEYDVPGIRGLCVSGGGTYCGLRFVDAKNSASIPPVWLYDAGARYRISMSDHGFTINLHIVNLLNTNYWAAYKPSGTVGLCLGAPRLISLSAKYEF